MIAIKDIEPTLESDRTEGMDSVKSWLLPALAVLSVGVSAQAWSSTESSVDAAATDERSILDAVVVTSTQKIGSTAHIRRAFEKYMALPAQARTGVALRFYLTDKKRNEIIDADLAARLIIQVEEANGDLTPVDMTSSGQLLFRKEHLEGNQALSIVANARSAAIEISPKATMEFAEGATLTLGYLRRVSSNFLEVHKLYAGMLFRQFIGSRKPNCIGFSFPTSQTVSASHSNGKTWQMGPDAKVVMFFVDVAGLPDDAVVAWTGPSPPERTIACLMDRK